jgi:hypothetical protein
MRISFTKVAPASVALAVFALVRPLASQTPKAERTSTATAPAPASTHCGHATLAECTKARVASLNELSKTFRELATQPTGSHLTADETKHVEQYNRWLTETASHAEALAKSGSATVGEASGSNSSQQLMSATQAMQEVQMSFNLQYLMLQQNMQQENQQYSAVSNIMKEKYNTSKKAIANIK